MTCLLLCSAVHFRAVIASTHLVFTRISLFRNKCFQNCPTNPILHHAGKMYIACERPVVA
jgi:hypothetical protein